MQEVGGGKQLGGKFPRFPLVLCTDLIPQHPFLDPSLAFQPTGEFLLSFPHPPIF